jgi:hypothetical protein
MSIWERFLAGLPSVKDSPLTLIGLVVIVGAYVYVTIKTGPINLAFRSIRNITNDQEKRLAVQDILRLRRPIPERINAEQYLRERRMELILTAFIATLLAGLITFAIAVVKAPVPTDAEKRFDTFVTLILSDLEKHTQSYETTIGTLNAAADVLCDAPSYCFEVVNQPVGVQPDKNQNTDAWCILKNNDEVPDPISSGKFLSVYTCCYSCIDHERKLRHVIFTSEHDLTKIEEGLQTVGKCLDEVTCRPGQQTKSLCDLMNRLWIAYDAFFSKTAGDGLSWEDGGEYGYYHAKLSVFSDYHYLGKFVQACRNNFKPDNTFDLSVFLQPEQ